MDEHRRRNGLEEAKSTTKRPKSSKRRRSSAAAAWPDDAEVTKVPKFDSPSKLKIKFVVQSAKSDAKVTTNVRNLGDEISAARPVAMSPTKKLSVASLRRSRSGTRKFGLGAAPEGPENPCPPHGTTRDQTLAVHYDRVSHVAMFA